MRFFLRLMFAVVAAVASTMAVAQSGTIGQAASAMQAGEWRQIGQGGDASGWGSTLLKTGSDNLLNYADKGLWNPNTRELQFLGKGCCGEVFKFLTYTESTNRWTQEAKPYWDCSPATNCYGHGYEHSTLDPATGNVFWRPYNSSVIYKWTRSTKTWSALPSGPNPTIAVAIEYFPDLGGLVLVGAGQIHLFVEATNTWTQLASGLTMGEYHNVASYNPVHKIVVFGGGNGSANLYKVDASRKVSAIQKAPVNVGILASVLTVDPASGRYLLLGAGGGFYQYDVAGNTWATLSSSGVPVWSPDSNRILYVVAVPVTSYGVVAFLTTYWSDSTSKVYLYKHAAGTIVPKDTTPPPAPTGVTVQ